MTLPKISIPAIYSHTGLRGIASMYVFLFHLSDHSGWHPTWQLSHKFDQLFKYGGYSVDLFFILSGFILNWVYLSNATSMEWKEYFKARAARILPLYFLTTLLLLVIMGNSLAKFGFSFAGKDFAMDLLSNLLLFSGIESGWHHTINNPAWSIGVEFFCYLVTFPFLYYFLRLLPVKRAGSIILIALAAVSTICLVLFYNLAPIPIFNSTWDCTWLARGIFGFAAGFFLCSLFQRSKNSKPSNGLVNSLVLAFFAIFFLSSYGLVSPYMLLCSFPFLAYFLAFDKGIVARVLKTDLFQWTGERSYSIYLWHFPCIICYVKLEQLFYTRFPHAHFPGLIDCLFVIIIVLGISELSYRFFESPARTFIRKRF